MLGYPPIWRLSMLAGPRSGRAASRAIRYERTPHPRSYRQVDRGSRPAELGRIGGDNEDDRNRLRCQKGRNALPEVPITAPVIPGIEIANDVHKSGTRLDAIVIGNARFVPSRRKLGSFFELDLLKK